MEVYDKLDFKYRSPGEPFEIDLIGFITQEEQSGIWLFDGDRTNKLTVINHGVNSVWGADGGQLMGVQYFDSAYIINPKKRTVELDMSGPRNLIFDTDKIRRRVVSMLDVEGILDEFVKGGFRRIDPNHQ